MTAVLVIAVLSFDVVRKINQQSTASTDNVQWTVAQINVEFMQLLLAIDGAIDAHEPISSVRQRFDVFYSRMNTMRLSPIFAVLRDDPEFAAGYQRIWEFLDRRVPVIDGPDDALAQALPELAEEVRALRQDASVMGLTGIRVFARRTDAEREGIARTLLQVSVLTLGLIVAMGVLTATLARMNATIKRQALRNQVQGERVKAVFSTSLDAVIVVDTMGRVLEFNAAAEAMFGYTASEVLGQPMGPLIIPPDQRAAHEGGMHRIRTTGEQRVVGSGRLRLQAMRKGGAVFPVELAVSVSDGPDGKIFVSFLRDMSAQVAAEQELLRARDDALAGEKAKAELLAVMSHEMRTPLNGMLGTMELLKETRLSAKQQQYQRIMESSGRLLLHHVNDVLDIVRVDSGKAVISVQWVDLATLIGDIVDGQMPVALAGVNQLRAVLPSDGRTMIEVDPVRLRQVLLNLVGNALKFTRNGEVCIEVERLDAEALIEFRVTDTGIGIKEEDCARIFDDFVTLDPSYARSASGTGLGLGIVRRWVHAMGGEVGVESEVGEGSLFWVRLPLLHPAERPQTSREAAGAPTSSVGLTKKRLTILVVEDNPVNRLVVREMLESDGHTVVEAHDGDEGTRMAALRTWDVILMDVSMPGKDGVEATRDIRRSNGPSANSPIVALTAHALPTETARFREAGMQYVMTKPVSREVLRQVLKQVTEPNQTREPAPDQPARQAEPFLDASIFGQLRETLGAAGTQRLVQGFLAETEPLIAQWATDAEGAVPERDGIEAMRHDVHKLAGSAAILGTARLRGRLAETETACKTGTGTEALNGLQKVVSEWPETRAALMAASAKG